MLLKLVILQVMSYIILDIFFNKLLMILGYLPMDSYIKFNEVNLYELKLDIKVYSYFCGGGMSRGQMFQQSTEVLILW